MSVLLETTAGNIVIDLFVHENKSLAYRFIKLCKINHYFFEQIRVSDSSLSAGSDDIELEVPEYSKGRETYDGLGIVSFNKASSEFIISIAGEKSIPYGFGKVQEGYATLNKITKTGGRILHTHVLHDPFPDPPDLAKPKELVPTPAQIASLSREELDNISASASASEKVDEQDEEMEHHAVVLELLKDLPHYNVKPSPRLLFVAKLNPITSSNSLEVVFGRYGQVLSANVVRNKEGKSLSYGFVEFATKVEAEIAYEKLQECLIDGKRIVVDFSQSTKKLQK